MDYFIYCTHVDTLFILSLHEIFHDAHIIYYIHHMSIIYQIDLMYYETAKYLRNVISACLPSYNQYNSVQNKKSTLCFNSCALSILGYVHKFILTLEFEDEDTDYFPMKQIQMFRLSMEDPSICHDLIEQNIKFSEWYQKEIPRVQC